MTREEAWDELKILFETKFEIQKRCIQQVEAENHLLRELLQEIGAKVDVQVKPYPMFSDEPIHPTEIKFVHIQFDKRFVSHSFKERLEAIDRKIEYMRGEGE